MFRSYFAIATFLFFALTNFVSASILSPEQASWLERRHNTLIVRPERNYPPFSFISSSTSTKPKGLAVDYLELVARKIEAQPTFLEAKSRSVILKEIKSGKEGVVLALTENDDLLDSMYFSEAFINLPAVIVTRRDYQDKKELSLADFNAKQIAVTDGYEVVDFLKNNYPRIILETVSDDEVAIQKLLLGEVDAAVMDLASLSYYTSRDVLSYVKVAGQTGFDYKLAFAVPKSMPELAAILNSGLKEITQSEKQIVSDRWINFEQKQSDQTKNKFSFINTPIWMSTSIIAILIIVILLTFIIIHSRRHHRSHNAVLERAHEITELKEELDELNNASLNLEKNKQEIESLKRAIKEELGQK